MRRIASLAASAALSLAVYLATVTELAAGTATAIAVDAAAAARMISQYRASHGLPPVKIEARLARIAAVHSQRMAAADRLDHVLPGEGSFPQRMAAGGYPAGMAAENIAAGQDSLTDAMAAWKASPAHNRNLLQRDVTEIGIALYSTPVGPYKTYWTLVLARPAAPQPANAPQPSGGFFVGPFGFGIGLN
jgi:uncharacterized protein YkwD